MLCKLRKVVLVNEKVEVCWQQKIVDATNVSLILYKQTVNIQVNSKVLLIKICSVVVCSFLSFFPCVLVSSLTCSKSPCCWCSHWFSILHTNTAIPHSKPSPPMVESITLPFLPVMRKGTTWLKRLVVIPNPLEIK